MSLFGASLLSTGSFSSVPVILISVFSSSLIKLGGGALQLYVVRFGLYDIWQILCHGGSAKKLRRMSVMQKQLSSSLLRAFEYQNVSDSEAILYQLDFSIFGWEDMYLLIILNDNNFLSQNGWNYECRYNLPYRSMSITLVKLHAVLDSSGISFQLSSTLHG